MAPAALPSPPDAASLHTTWRALMDQALRQAMLAADEGETPVGALLVSPRGETLAQAHNQSIRAHDPTAHAEILCLRQAAQAAGSYRLTGSILVVTLEPCLMCLGALIHARVAGVVFGAPDPKAGALVTHLPGTVLPFANHKLWALAGVMEEECGGLLRRFFLQRRKA